MITCANKSSVRSKAIYVHSATMFQRIASFAVVVVGGIVAWSIARNPIDGFMIGGAVVLISHSIEFTRLSKSESDAMIEGVQSQAEEEKTS